MHALVSLEGLLIKHIGLLSKFSLSSFAKVFAKLQYSMHSPGLFVCFLALELRRGISDEICTKKFALP